MAKTNLFYGALLSGTMISGMFGTWAFAADVEKTSLPAVSAINGKVDLQGGWADGNGVGVTSEELLFGGAALSVPLGDAWGLQADIAALRVFDETSVGGTLHFFTRDPSSHLLGAVGGYVDTSNGHMVWGGAEGEAYMGNITLRAMAGISDVSVSGPVGDGTDFLGIAEMAFYANDNLKLWVEGSTVANFEAVGAGMEWLLQDQLGVPVSLKFSGGVGENGYTAATAGVSFYFGGNEADKSLIRRHREDDPEIEAFPGGAVNVFGAGVLGGGPCMQQGPWNYETKSYVMVPCSPPPV